MFTLMKTPDCTLVFYWWQCYNEDPRLYVSIFIDDNVIMKTPDCTLVFYW
jgi:hypothetical protein